MLSKLKQRLKGTTSSVETLNSTVSHVRSNFDLHELPGKFAEILEAYSRIPVQEPYRADVHNLLVGAVDIATSVFTKTTHADTAIKMINNQIALLAHISTHLSNRPTKIGYSIFAPGTNTFLGQFNTQQEAEQQLQSLQLMGHGKHAMVIPVKITSQLSFRPDKTEQAVQQQEGVFSHQALTELEDVIQRPGETTLLVEQLKEPANVPAGPNPTYPTADPTTFPRKSP